jgi:hypothetical protein
MQPKELNEGKIININVESCDEKDDSIPRDSDTSKNLHFEGTLGDTSCY